MTVIILTALRVATGAPTLYSETTRTIPLMPPGAALGIVLITSISNDLLVYNPIAKPVITTKFKVIKIAGFIKL